MAVLERIGRFLIDHRHRSAVLDDEVTCPRNGDVPVSRCRACPWLDDIVAVADADLRMVVCSPPTGERR